LPGKRTRCQLGRRMCRAVDDDHAAGGSGQRNERDRGPPDTHERTLPRLRVMLPLLRKAIRRQGNSCRTDTRRFSPTSAQCTDFVHQRVGDFDGAGADVGRPLVRWVRDTEESDLDLDQAISRYASGTSLRDGRQN
jgi:hypothetical protein